MRGVATLVLTAGLVACGGGGDDSGRRGAVGADISLADVAGSWDMVGRMATGSEPTSITYTLTATDSEEGWTLHLPEREPIAITILAVDADSIVGETAQFESILREGVMVTTRTVLRLRNGTLAGTMVATYDTDPVETLPGRFRGRRAGTDN